MMEIHHFIHQFHQILQFLMYYDTGFIRTEMVI